jgi:hypothetical protein
MTVRLSETLICEVAITPADVVSLLKVCDGKVRPKSVDSVKLPRRNVCALMPANGLRVMSRSLIRYPTSVANKPPKPCSEPLAVVDVSGSSIGRLVEPVDGPAAMRPSTTHDPGVQVA